MTGKRRQPAYFAVARGIGDHPFFNYGKPAYSWREAWEWLIEQAAYRPKGHRHVRGIFPLLRGELCATEREMAAAWRWSKTAVHHFLRRLSAEGMIRPESRPDSKGKRRRIIICNYDRFQPGRSIIDHALDQTDDRMPPQLPGFGTTISPLNNETDSRKEVRAPTAGGTPLRLVNYGDKSDRTPRHGAISADKVWQWFNASTPEWRDAAEFDHEKRNVTTFPEVRADGGRGNWFKRRTLAEWQQWGRKRLATGG